MSGGYPNLDGSWTNVLDDGTTFTDREAWMHVPDLVKQARTAAEGVIALRHMQGGLNSAFLPFLEAANNLLLAGSRKQHEESSQQ